MPLPRAPHAPFCIGSFYLGCLISTTPSRRAAGPVQLVSGCYYDLPGQALVLALPSPCLARVSFNYHSRHSNNIPDNLFIYIIHMFPSCSFAWNFRMEMSQLMLLCLCAYVQIMLSCFRRSSVRPFLALFIFICFRFLAQSMAVSHTVDPPRTAVFFFSASSSYRATL